MALFATSQNIQTYYIPTPSRASGTSFLRLSSAPPHPPLDHGQIFIPWEEARFNLALTSGCFESAHHVVETLRATGSLQKHGSTSVVSVRATRNLHQLFQTRLLSRESTQLQTLQGLHVNLKELRDQSLQRKESQIEVQEHLAQVLQDLDQARRHYHKTKQLYQRLQKPHASESQQLQSPRRLSPPPTLTPLFSPKASAFQEPVFQLRPLQPSRSSISLFFEQSGLAPFAQREGLESILKETYFRKQGKNWKINLSQLLELHTNIEHFLIERQKAREAYILSLEGTIHERNSYNTRSSQKTRHLLQTSLKVHSTSAQLKSQTQVMKKGVRAYLEKCPHPKAPKKRRAS